MWPCFHNPSGKEWGFFVAPVKRRVERREKNAGFEMDSQPGTWGMVQEPQPDQSYSSVVTPGL